MVKVKDLPATITDAFTTLAPAIGCSALDESLDRYLFDFNTNTPSTTPLSGITNLDLNGDVTGYSAYEGNYLPCFSNHLEYIEHIFNTRYIEVSYDLSASWYSFTNQFINEVVQGTYKIYFNKRPNTPALLEDDFETLLPKDRCCISYFSEPANTFYGYDAWAYSNDNKVAGNGSPINFLQNFFLLPSNLYQNDAWVFDSVLGYQREFQNLIGTVYYSGLGGGTFNRTGGGTFGVPAGYRGNASSTACYYVINGNTYEGNVYLDVAGNNLGLTGNVTITFHTFNYNIP